MEKKEVVQMHIDIKSKVGDMTVEQFMALLLMIFESSSVTISREDLNKAMGRVDTLERLSTL